MEDEINERIAAINRHGGKDTITDVFYSLQEHRVSVGKATQVVSHYLKTGKLEPFARSQGTDECEALEVELRGEITRYRAAMRHLAEMARSEQAAQIVALADRWQVETPEIRDYSVHVGMVAIAEREEQEKAA